MKKRWSIALGAALLTVGCTGGLPQGKSGSEAGAMRKRSLEELPAVGEYAPPVDDGRLLVAAPAGWSLLPRGRSYLIGFGRGKPSELPRIVISAQETPPDSPPQLDAENALTFAARRAAELKADVQAGRKQVEEYPLPIQLGPNVFVRHVRRASLGGIPCVVQALETVQQGRLYSVELIVAVEAARSEEYEASLLKWRDQGYAVAAHLRFAPPDERFDVFAAPQPLEAPAQDAPAASPSPGSAPAKSDPAGDLDPKTTRRQASPASGSSAPKKPTP